MSTLSHKCGCDTFCQGQKTIADFSGHLNQYFTDSFPIYMVASLTRIRFWYHFMWHPPFGSLFALCFLISGSKLGNFLAVPAVLTLGHISSKALKLQLQHVVTDVCNDLTRKLPKLHFLFRLLSEITRMSTSVLSRCRPQH